MKKYLNAIQKLLPSWGELTIKLLDGFWYVSIEVDAMKTTPFKFSTFSRDVNHALHSAHGALKMWAYREEAWKA